MCLVSLARREYSQDGSEKESYSTGMDIETDTIYNDHTGGRVSTSYIFSRGQDCLCMVCWSV